ncbi:MAG: class I SAM-dependent methyltransferase [Acetobacteraceae bacterium]|nr:class I SAM-dependent methyltransferase [Acetobacteraceae bacterium]
MSGDSGESGRFGSTADHYLAGRPAYADLLIRRVAALAGLGRGHDVLDLGCGPGQLARAFAPLARTVVAMDPEPEMLRVATEASAGIGTIRFVHGGSADLAPGLGRFHLVVMGRSFHWMDRAATLRALDGLIEPGGAVALFHTEHAELLENAWVARYNEVRRRYAEDDSRQPHRHAGWVRHEAFLLDSPFRCVEACAVLERRAVALDRLVDRALSMSSSSRERLGAKTAALEHDIALLSREIAPEGQLTEVIRSSALLARRPHEEGLP